MLANQFLQDIKVLDLSQYIPGPFATRQLADLGARVIKIEPPGGDPMRHFSRSADDSICPLYRHLNRGKIICRLNLKSATGKQWFHDLLIGADVLLESFRPGVLSRLGFDRDSLIRLNPRLIHCALSGYGQTGPYRQRAGHDINYNAASGVLAARAANADPVIIYPPLADHAAAMQASVSILAALHARQRSNQGAYIDISLFEASMSWQSLPLLIARSSQAKYFLAGGAACYNIYPCADGKFISLGALELPFWRRFCETMERPEWIERQYEPMPQRQLIKQLGAALILQPREFWIQRFSGVDCCFEAVLMPDEVSSHVQTQSRGALTNCGPAYPGYINHSPVGLNENFSELAAGDIPTWDRT